ncbi:TIGR02587 family membrane protein [soil metagenome]
MSRRPSKGDGGRGPWREELVDVVRAVSGGLLFGIPLLYTTEVWSTGSSTRPGQTLVVLGLTTVPVLLLNRTSGFRSTRDIRWGDALMDTVEAMAIGLLSVTVILILLGELNGRTPLQEGLGQVVYGSVPFCIGIGVAAHFLQRGRDESDEDDAGGGDTGTKGSERMNGTLADLGATLIGAVFLSLSIAPTDEVPMLASALDPPWLLGLMGLSLLACYGIVFVAGFAKEEQRHAQRGIFQRPVSETVAAYLVALGASWSMLVIFQNVEGPWPATLSQVVVLGLPAAIGGAAGRLAI